MRVLLEGLPHFLWGRPWSRVIPGRLRYRLERLAATRFYRRLPPPHLRIRAGSGAARLVITGDLSLHRWTAAESPARVFQAVRRVFAAADLSVVNLESVLTSCHEPSGRIGAFLKAAPGAIECLSFLGVGAATSANNHALDFGAAGLAECGGILRRAGIEWFGIEEDGAGDSIPGAFTREVNGVVIGFLAATDHFGGVPSQARPTPVWVEPSQLRRHLRILRALCHVVVVQLHWGYEYVMYPLRWHRDLARQLVDEGADLVCCHHAHVVMGVEQWGRGVIAHGLGNFYFGPRRPDHPRHPLGRFGILLDASVDRAGLVSCDVISVRTDEAGVVQRETEACPGFHRICARLTEDAFLERHEDAQIGAALAQMTLDLRSRIASADVAGLLERRVFFSAPRQRWLLDRAQQSDSPARRRIGGWLREFRSLPAEAVQQLAIPRMPHIGSLPRWLDTRFQPGRWP